MASPEMPNPHQFKAEPESDRQAGPHLTYHHVIAIGDGVSSQAEQRLKQRVRLRKEDEPE